MQAGSTTDAVAPRNVPARASLVLFGINVLVGIGLVIAGVVAAYVLLDGDDSASTIFIALDVISRIVAVVALGFAIWGMVIAVRRRARKAEAVTALVLSSLGVLWMGYWLAVSVWEYGARY
ncbi:hypothetical protein IF188_19205 [Microbacterium sp. NEAU-LLC]|uniref:Uncharacterized protein n=1 Tax=Microbacterium helvum TaxID=2773713 RepID=A0ABR8NXM9_9MICO|nr:hypothetical protein [Microbacterium helvum]MBD3943826.1 hypothetical protein [Microbacterium helvum]